MAVDHDRGQSQHMKIIRQAWGIELGSSALKAVGVQVAKSGRAKIIGWRLMPWPRGLLPNDPQQRRELIVNAVRTLTSSDRIQAQSLFSILPQSQCVQKLMERSDVKGCDREEALRKSTFSRIPLAPDDATWAFGVFRDNPGSTARPRSAVVFVAKNEVIANHLSPFRNAGYLPSGVFSQAISLHNLGRYVASYGNEDDDAERSPQSLVLDLGACGSTLVCSGPGVSWCRYFPLGGEHFTERLSQLMDWPRQRAEQAKLKITRLRNPREFFAGLKPVFEQLADQVHRSRAMLSADGLTAPLERLVLTGGASRLPGLEQFLTQQLQMRVIRFAKFPLDDPSGKFGPHADRLAAAAGAALTGCGLGGLAMSPLRDGLTAQQTRTPFLQKLNFLRKAGTGA